MAIVRRMRFLVTGATGKVGNAVARRLAERGDEVVALVRNAAKARELLPTGVELARGDVTDPDSVRASRGGRRAASSTAWACSSSGSPDPGVFERVNAEGARNVIAAAREAGVRRAVHTSTFDVFHAETGRHRVARPRSPTTRRARRTSAPSSAPRSWCSPRREHGIEVVIVNPSSVYGPGPVAGRRARPRLSRRDPPPPAGASRPAG